MNWDDDAWPHTMHTKQAVARRSTESGALVVGDPCPLCGTPLPDLWEGVRECEFCGWQEWQPYETAEMHERHLRSRR
jgi:uncharacterized Zn finger protein (UPF0148 family)